jgi:hypothetical protein
MAYLEILNKLRFHPMAFHWKMAGKNCDEVKSSVEGLLKAKGLPSFADVSWQGHEMCVRLEKGGKSEFRIALKPSGSDTQIVEVKRDVAFLHKPFVGKVESFVGELMLSLGAQKV